LGSLLQHYQEEEAVGATLEMLDAAMEREIKRTSFSISINLEDRSLSHYMKAWCTKLRIKRGAHVGIHMLPSTRA
jgi:hypothetical protein